MNWRFASPDDSRALAELNRQLIVDEGHRNPMTTEQLEQRMLHWLESSYRAVLFEEGDHVVAYALFCPDESGDIYLRQFFVIRERRRQGVGRSALRALRHDVFPDARRISLDVLTDNPGAVRSGRRAGSRNMP